MSKTMIKQWNFLMKYKKKRDTFSYKSKKIWQGLIEGKSDENIGNTSAFVSDLFLFGDLRDLTIQGLNYKNHEEVDEVIVTLSAIGVIASASTITSAGATTGAKVAISTLKTCQKKQKDSQLDFKICKKYFWHYETNKKYSTHIYNHTRYL